MADLIQFVSAIDAAPTVLLDLNDETVFFCRSFSAPPPRLRRSVAANAMRDGVHVGSSSYDARTLVAELDVLDYTQDDMATEMQKLWRILDAEVSILKYQPDGATKPVFFRVFRSDASQLEDVRAQAAMRTITLELLAEPFALGLKESLGPFTVSNDPAAGSNGCYFNISAVKGDVDVPLVLWHDNTNRTTRDLLAVHRAGNNPVFTWTQAEAASGITLGTDTTKPAGGPDADMSGTGTNNYLRTSFATNLTMVERMRWAVPAITPSGRYRVVLLARHPSSPTQVSVQLWAPDADGVMAAVSPVVLPEKQGSGFTFRSSIDMGVVSIGPAGGDLNAGYSTTPMSLTSRSLSFRASSTAVANFDWDAVLLIPADDLTTSLIVDHPYPSSSTGGLVIDGVRDRVVLQTLAGDPTTGAGSADSSITPLAAGVFPLVSPGVTNRAYLLRTGVAIGATWNDKTVTGTVSGAYWPRYLFCRPVSS